MPFSSIGPGELILILVIALVVLGPGKLPDVASSLGKSLREFRKAANDVTEATRIDTPPQPATTPTTAAVVAPPTPAAAAPVAPAAPAEPGGDPEPAAAPATADPARDANAS